MKIKIPYSILRAWDAWEAWVNVPVWYRKYSWPRIPVRQFEIRRIDVILAAGFVFCVGYYGYTSGWQGAIMGGVLYLAIAAMALWML